MADTYMKQFFMLISNLYLILAFDLASRRSKPLKITAFLRNFDFFGEQLSKYTNSHEGQSRHNSLWFYRQSSWKSYSEPL